MDPRHAKYRESRDIAGSHAAASADTAAGGQVGGANAKHLTVCGRRMSVDLGRVLACRWLAAGRLFAQLKRQAEKSIRPATRIAPHRRLALQAEQE